VVAPAGKTIVHYVERLADADAKQLCLVAPINSGSISAMLTTLESLFRNKGALGTAVSNLKDTSATLDTAKKLDLKALIVDDSAAVRVQVQEALSGAGVECSAVESAASALERLKSSRFDIVILDVVMPGMDGLEACKHVRAGKGGQDTTIIMLTSQSAPAMRVQAALSGCDAYLTKPIDKQALFSAIDRAIAKRAELRGVPISGLQSGRGFTGLLARLRG
jgi:CheY-like chemotaxis protein